MSKKFYRLDPTTRTIVETTLDDYNQSHGQTDTMMVDGSKAKKKISLDVVDGSLSDILNFLSNVK